jgi:hypothetical protein
MTWVLRKHLQPAQLDEALIPGLIKMFDHRLGAAGRNDLPDQSEIIELRHDQCSSLRSVQFQPALGAGLQTSSSFCTGTLQAAITRQQQAR